MPKKTFKNLKESKQKLIKDAFLREFAIHTFDKASISIVVKKLNIAKGSIYQYFNDKLDLFIYLIQECSSVKSKYLEPVKRSDYPDFWSFFRDLYEKGYLFDKENPLESHFLHNLGQNLNSPSVTELYQKMLQQTVSGFEEMVKYEVKQKLFRDDIPIQTMGFTLYKLGMSIQEQLEFSGSITPKQSINNNTPVYKERKEILLQTVDQYIQLYKPAFEKQTTL